MGKLTEPNFSYYEGFFHNNKKHGKGVFVSKHLKVFDQEFNNGERISHVENLKKRIQLQNQEQAEKMALVLEKKKSKKIQEKDSPIN